jgi:hypothetical protein
MLGEIFQRVADIVAGAKCRATDLEGVCAMQDRLAADLGGFGGRQQPMLMITGPKRGISEPESSSRQETSVN